MNHLTKNMTTSKHFMFMGKLLLMFCILSSMGHYAYAQDKIIPSVKGTVKNDTNERLAGATITVSPFKS